MRIAVGQLWQETNTFNPNPTRPADFDAMGVAHGADIVAQYGRTGELSGFLDAFSAQVPDAEYVGLSRYACWPWGAVDRKAWSEIRRSFQSGLKKAGPVDGVLLVLHGAMSAVDEPDVTGTLLELVSTTVGKDVPVVGTLDLHANITRKMLTHSHALAGYHACPHIDGVETGARAANALRICLKSKTRPVTYTRKLPMITAAESHNTFTGPPSSLYRRLQELERQAGVLTAGLYMAMPWFDCPDLGWCLTLTVDKPDSRWDEVLDHMVDEAWQLRTEMENVDRLPPREVVDLALSFKRRPIVIGDGADATNSGAPGDSTVLLAEFLKRDSIPGGALTFLVDPKAVRLAQEAGEGGAFDANVGGQLSTFSAPVRLTGTVKKLLDVKWVLSGHICNNLPIDMGAGAVIKAGQTTVLLCERSGPGSSPKLYETAGLDPRRFGIVVAKSPAGFRADYSPIASEMLLADCPGCASPHWDRMPFEHISRPLWPLDPIAEPSEAKWLQNF